MHSRRNLSQLKYPHVKNRSNTPYQFHTSQNYNVPSGRGKKEHVCSTHPSNSQSRMSKRSSISSRTVTADDAKYMMEMVEVIRYRTSLTGYLKALKDSVDGLNWEIEELRERNKDGQINLIRLQTRLRKMHQKEHSFRREKERKLQTQNERLRKENMKLRRKQQCQSLSRQDCYTAEYAYRMAMSRTECVSSKSSNIPSVDQNNPKALSCAKEMGGPTSQTGSGERMIEEARNREQDDSEEWNLAGEQQSVNIPLVHSEKKDQFGCLDIKKLMVSYMSRGKTRRGQNQQQAQIDEYRDLDFMNSCVKKLQ